MIKVLERRNEEVINYDSFKPYMQTFCSQLVVIHVLLKMERPDIIKDLFSAWFTACANNELPDQGINCLIYNFPAAVAAHSSAAGAGSSSL